MTDILADKLPATTTIDKLLADFEVEVRDDYPSLKHDFMLADVLNNKVYTHFDQLTDGSEASAALMASLQEFMKDSSDTGDSLAGRLRLPVANGDLYTGHVIAFNMPVPDVVTPLYQRAALSTLYHELGHLVVPGAGQLDDGFSDNYKEIAADIYALARFQQKFGSAVTDRMGYIMSLNVADGFVLNDDHKHMSLFAIAEFLKVKEQIDFDAMSLSDIATLASRLAQQHAQPDSVYQQASAWFKEYREEMTTNFPVALEKLADKLAAADPYVYRIGRNYIDKFLQDGLTFSGEQPVLDPATKQRIADKLRASDFLLNAGDVTAGLPKKAAPSQNNAPQVAKKLAM